MTIRGFVWSLWNWLCGPEVDFTGGCMFSLVWTRLLFMLQRIKTAEWVFLFLHHLCPNVSQQQLMLQWWFCQQKSPPEYIIPIITVFFFPVWQKNETNISMTHRFGFFFVCLYLSIKSFFFLRVCLISSDNYGVLSIVSEFLFNTFIFISASIHWDLNLWAERALSKVIQWMKTQSKGYFDFMIQKILSPLTRTDNSHSHL